MEYNIQFPEDINPEELGYSTDAGATLEIHGVPDGSIDDVTIPWLRRMLGTMVGSIVSPAGEYREEILGIGESYRIKTACIAQGEAEPPVIHFRRFETRKSWYLLWCKQYKSGWAVHAMYMPKDIAVLVPKAKFWRLDWSACTHKGYLNEVSAIQEMDRVSAKRREHEYICTRWGKEVGGELVEDRYAEGGMYGDQDTL